MEMYNIWRAVFIGSLVLAIVFLAATVLLFFMLKIKTAFDDITGTSKRRAIEDIQNKSASSESVSRVDTKNYANKSTSQKLVIESAETSKIRPQDRFDNLAPETTQLDQPSSETTVLSPADLIEEKEVAFTPSQAQPVAMASYNGNDPDFIVEVDITYVHASEYIK